MSSMEILKGRTFAFIDVETTGGSATYDRIIEIGIIRVENGKVVRKYTSLIDPQKYISPFITGITGIRPEDVNGAPLFEDIQNEVRELLDGAIFVAHNARFDYGFLKNEFKRVGVSFNAKCLCSVRLSRRLFSRHKRHDLSSIIERCGIRCDERHRALGDAAAIWDFFCHIETIGRGLELIEAIDHLLKRPSYPQLLDEKTVRDLPYGPGVYVFYGEGNVVLYVGKSRNLRYRVLSHFSGDHSSSKEMHLCQQTKKIETVRTAGELGALLLESKMIKDLCPYYNRQLRRTSLLVIAKKKVIDGYNSVSLERLDEIVKEDQRNVMAVFKNVTQGKKFLRAACDELGLCPKILGLEKSKGSCFNHQLEKCRGACVGEEATNAFNQKFESIFARRRLKAWPFKGPITIEEKLNGRKHSFLIDNWCLLSEYDSEDSEASAERQAKFDYDSYKILTAYLRDKKNVRNITEHGVEKLQKIMREEPVIQLC